MALTENEKELLRLAIRDKVFPGDVDVILKNVATTTDGDIRDKMRPYKENKLVALQNEAVAARAQLSAIQADIARLQSLDIED